MLSPKQSYIKVHSAPLSHVIAIEYAREIADEMMMLTRRGADAARHNPVPMELRRLLVAFVIVVSHPIRKF